MGTNLTYNNIELTNVTTLDFDERVVEDESGTDALYHEFTIRVSFVVHQSDKELIHGYSGSSSFMSSIQHLESALMLKRKSFHFSINGFKVLFSDQENDCNNGPTPLSFKVVRVMGSNSAVCEYSIKVAILRCHAEDSVQYSSGNPNILNNRWSVEESRDEDMALSLQIEGVLRLRNANVGSPLAFRDAVIPTLQKGYKRHHIRVVSSKDGLTLRYSILDKQGHEAPPWPAVSWSGTYTETVKGGGGLQHAYLNIRLKGHPDASRKTLAFHAGEIAVQKIPALKDKTKAFLEEFTLMESLHENTVELRCRVRHLLAVEDYKEEIVKKIGVPLKFESIKDYDKKRWQQADFPAGSPGLALTCYLQSPCGGDHAIKRIPAATGQSSEQSDDQPDTETGYGDLTQEQVNQDPQYRDGNQIDNETQQKGMYDPQRSTMMVHYTTDQGKIPLPIAAGGELQSVDSKEDTVKTIKVTSGVTYKHYKINLIRLGAPPEHPALPQTRKNTAGVTETLIDCTKTPINRGTDADGVQSKFQLIIRATYSLSRSLTEDEQLEAVLPPWIADGEAWKTAQEAFDTAQEAASQAINVTYQSLNSMFGDD